MSLSSELTDHLDVVLEHAVQSDAAPGIAATVVEGDGVLYESARGSLGAPERAPARPDTLFRLASMTKPLVSAAALRLVEDGRLALDMPVGDVVAAYDDLLVL